MWSALLGLSIALLLLGLTARNLQPRLTKGLVKQVMDLQDALRDVLIKNSIYKNNLDISMERVCLLYTSPSPRDRQKSRMPSSA